MTAPMRSLCRCCCPSACTAATCWVLDRDLLITGAAMPIGAGDVQGYGTTGASSVAHCWPKPRTSPGFIDRTRPVVSVGTEPDHCEIDGKLACLFTIHN